MLDRCDAVYVCSWTSEHPRLVAAAAERGVHVFCEKPLAVDLATADTRGTARSEARKVAGEVLDPAAVGARVRSPIGGAVVNPAGQFLISARPGDEIVVETDPPRTAVVPDTGGVRVP